MKLAVTIGAVMLCFAAASAQESDTRSRTRIVVEDGKTMSVTGCLRKSLEGDYTLTQAAGKDGAVGSYVLTASDDEDDLDDLAQHVGHRVEVSGKAANRGDGKIKVSTKSETRRADGEKGRAETTSEVKGDLAGLPYLGVKSFRMIASVCP